MSELHGCVAIARFVDTYIDGEFSEADRIDFERHLVECEACDSKVRAQQSWQRVVHNTTPREEAPQALRQQLLKQVSKKVGRERTMRVWTRRLVPTVAAAAMVIAYFIVPKSHDDLQWSPVTADVISKHERNYPLEVTGASDQVRQWYADKVDFPVRPPQFDGRLESASLSGTSSGPASVQPRPQVRFRASLRGGRLANIRDRQAAYLMYDVDGSKVSVFMFDPQEMPMSAKRRVVVGDRAVFFDEDHGYNVAMFEDRGVGYAIAADMDEHSLLSVFATLTAPLNAAPLIVQSPTSPYAQFCCAVVDPPARSRINWGQPNLLR